MFLRHNDLSSVISIHHWCCFFCMILIHWLLTLNRSLFEFLCIWHCLLTRHWFVQYQQNLYIGFSCSIILVQWLLLQTSHPFIFYLDTVYLHHFIKVTIQFLFSCSICVVLFNISVRLRLKEFLGINIHCKCVHMLWREIEVEKSVKYTN